MSSIHSQSSDSHLNDQDTLVTQGQVVQQQGQRFNGKTPAIKEEEEEDDETDSNNSGHTEDGANNVRTGNRKENINKNNPKEPFLQKSKSHRSSSNSTSSSNSNAICNGNSKSTITFEKQKVIPPRARAQSAQSVLSNLSLRSLLLQNNLPQQQPQQPPAGNENPSTVNYGNLNQQIQSPAMSSSMRRKAPSNVMFRRNSSENEIGLQLPFTDDKRLDLDSKQSIRRNPSKVSLLRRQYSSNVVQTVEIEDEDSTEEQDTDKYQSSSTINRRDIAEEDSTIGADDDEISQKKLTANALQKLSLLKNKNRKKRQSDSSSQSSEKIGDINESADDETLESITTPEESMTHLQFGNKRVILDSSSFLEGSNGFNNGSDLRPVQQNLNQQLFQSFQKTSLDVLQQLNGTSNGEGGKSKPKTKRNCKQICNPKKPLYTPAVLRDTAETNITIDDLMRPDSPQHTLMNNPQGNQVTRNNCNMSSQASVYSATSSILETCKNRISSFFFPNSNTSNSDLPYNMHTESPIPPRKDHWLPDSKRASCHYCHKLFTFFERKHHCRHCGDIFCNQHLSHWLYLNSSAEFIIGGGGMGTLSKICDGCLEAYENLIKNPNWKNQKNQNGVEDIAVVNLSPVTSNQNSSPKSNAKQFSESVAVNNKNGGVDAKKEDADMIGSVVGSVPADWNWSSF